eukprot:CAMPEP_0119379590 /NCGR_PEP_ID=MMETSP1334-20130426/53415_1 /TAXON_ID=127549 /ORGANISM="Calcidiscus leptoporus, Strain RCC1130" /LENGTH=241 /DNA_ID=CAMNT_0007399153 /DNA_START=14 /DNA_END=739 /DNA_ORIENTATION=-
MLLRACVALVVASPRCPMCTHSPLLLARSGTVSLRRPVLNCMLNWRESETAAEWGDRADGGWGSLPEDDGGAEYGGVGAWSIQSERSEGVGDPEWLSRVASPKARARQTIEATAVGEVDVPFTRRNGFHVEVRMQHSADRGESIHRMWVAREVMIEIAAKKGMRMEDLEIRRVSEAIVAFLAAEGVDLADPDWAMDDESVPFSSEFFAARTLCNYYPHLQQHLADTLLPAAESTSEASEQP